MKNAVLIVFLLISSSAFSQFRSDDTHFTFRYGLGNIGSVGYQSYSLNAELFLNDNISANYNFDLIYRGDDIRHFHTPLGLIGGPPLILLGLLSGRDTTSDLSWGKGGALIGLLVLILPDGIGIHIPVRRHWDISPYANLLGLEFIRDRNTNEHWIKYTASFGAKLTFLIKQEFSFAIYGELRKPVKFDWMTGYGVSFGYYF